MAGGCKNRLVVLGQDAFPKCVGVEHPFDALHSRVSEAGGVGGGLGRDEESGVRMVGRRRR